MQLMGRVEAFKIFTERETVQSGWYRSLAALTAMHISMSSWIPQAFLLQELLHWNTANLCTVYFHKLSRLHPIYSVLYLI